MTRARNSPTAVAGPPLDPWLAGRPISAGHGFLERPSRNIAHGAQSRSGSRQGASARIHPSRLPILFDVGTVAPPHSTVERGSLWSHGPSARECSFLLTNAPRHSPAMWFGGLRASLSWDRDPAHGSSPGLKPICRGSSSVIPDRGGNEIGVKDRPNQPFRTEFPDHFKGERVSGFPWIQ